MDRKALKGGVQVTKLHIKNNTSKAIEFCSGSKEYVLEPDEEITIEIEDDDVMYVDELHLR